MKEMIKLTATLTIICLIAGALLAGADAMTRERIAEADRARDQKALNTVLPPHDNAPDKDAVTVTSNGRDWTFAVARQNGAFAGAAVETSSPNGYSGEIRLMLGIGADGKTIGIAILAQKETPGLGANIQTPGFRSRLAGLDILKTKWNVKKDGGDIDHITAATISSRAVVDAVREALDAYTANRQLIETGGN
jgi:electron transport complex protein RnfG